MSAIFTPGKRRYVSVAHTKAIKFLKEPITPGWLRETTQKQTCERSNDPKCVKIGRVAMATTPNQKALHSAFCGYMTVAYCDYI